MLSPLDYLTSANSLRLKPLNVIKSLISVVKAQYISYTKGLEEPLTYNLQNYYSF